ncbi:myb family transcription factor EFM-like [Andrographis paniculata]|uniref:myb family transcription factor EFM-like n=1 Tax=Andrographis paniculata TaxID=175694 RepID=UPI0021E796E2|nr:myb family transcription factor EFM-like [Andrographis paniculata]
MGMLIHPELTLDCRISSGTWIPKTIGEFLEEVSTIENESAKILKLEDYVNRLQEEMSKIDVFKRELPLSVLLISDAIGAVKEELRRYKKSNAEPVLEEFIPLKKDDEKSNKVGDSKDKDANSRDKMNWMSSVQLWNSDNQVSSNANTDKVIPSKLSENNRNKKMKEEAINQPLMDNLCVKAKNRTSGRTFAPLNVCTNFPAMMFGKEATDLQPALSLGTPAIKNSEETNSCGFSSKPNSIRSGSSSPTNNPSNSKAASSQQQTSRKQRRCWSPELHRRFVGALQQLGGAQAATPKQIRELMQVDGLTNDEVKSHLQKYRLHTRKLPSTATTPAAATTATDHVLLGGLWGSQEQYSESSKTRSNSQSGSPHDPHHLPGSSRGTSTTCGDSAVEDEDDGKSETFL